MHTTWKFVKIAFWTVLILLLAIGLQQGCVNSMKEQARLAKLDKKLDAEIGPDIGTVSFEAQDLDYSAVYRVISHKGIRRCEITSDRTLFLTDRDGKTASIVKPRRLSYSPAGFCIKS